MQQVLLLCPLYNDEASFNMFAASVKEAVSELKDYQFHFLVINDGSFNYPNLKVAQRTTLIHLYRNLGHQKAIAIGLAYACQHLSFDYIIIMDGDGEDKPEDIEKLLHAVKSNNQITFASRASRQAGRRFKWLYFLYRMSFRAMTGKNISFGNFMLLPKTAAYRLVHMNEIWNHLAGAIIKSRMPYSTIPLHRGRRYSGESKMNFTSLALHGLGAIGVFIDIIATRLLVFTIAMIGISFIGIIAIIAIKFFTQAAIPGWATTAFSSMLIVLLQSFLLSLFTIFLYLSARSQRQFIPANHYEDHTASVEEL